MRRETLQVQQHESGQTLVDLLSSRFRCSKKQARALLDARQVFVNGKRIWMARHPVQSGDQVEAIHPDQQSARIQILKQTAGLIVVNKPPGWVTNNAANSLETRLRRQMDLPGLLAVHRLDRDTSGCVLFARDAATKEEMIPLFKEQRIVKVYRAIVIGRVSGQLRQITRDIDGQSAVTRVTVLDSNRDAAYLQLHIQTGRTHQIRKHLAAVRHAVLGDKTYAGDQRGRALFRSVPRQMLHASRLIFPDPATGTPVRVDAPLPGDMQNVLQALKLK